VSPSWPIRQPERGKREALWRVLAERAAIYFDDRGAAHRDQAALCRRVWKRRLNRVVQKPMAIFF